MSDEQFNGAASSDALADDSAAGDEVRQPSADEERLIELVGFLVQGLVTHPEEVEVDEMFDDIGIVYGVRVHPEDIGRVIGKEGRVANALRQVVRAAATKTGARIALEIITEDEPIELLDSDATTQ
ncbi:MAG TPA: KH domain-containing protein [Abditibacteriaceae bacterium]|nr:KH domain-containing protein [Abditibacteriaceae bacterium]